MLDNERLEFIMNELRREKTANVTLLARKCFVSPCTLRRDLDVLERRGLIIRAYGRAILAEHINEEIPDTVREQELRKEKAIIGGLAARLVRDGDCVLMDSSSTTRAVIPFLNDKRRLHIVTNGMQVAQDCKRLLNDASVFCTGGIMSPNRVFMGSAAQEQLLNFRPDILFFSCRAISLQDGVCDVSEEIMYMKRLMLRISRKKVFLGDSRKFSRTGNHITCPLDTLDAVISEECPSEAWVEALQKAGVELIYPKE